MTTIAYRDGVIAADSAAFAGWGRSGTCRKIARNDAGELAGAAGSATYMGAFLRWFEGGQEGEPPEAKVSDGCTDCGVIIRKGGVATLYEMGGHFEQTGPFFAFGSGAPEAKGAMFAGASPFMAICAAVELDAYTSGPVIVLSADGSENRTYSASTVELWR